MSSRVVCEVTIAVECAACGKLHTNTYKLYPGYDMPDPSIPPSWQEINGRCYCPNHKVTVKVIVRPA
jgi:hypothetical protein